MALSVRDIINNSNSFEEAQRAFNYEVNTNKNRLSETDFLKEANKKWPKGGNSQTTTTSTGGVIQSLAGIQSFNNVYSNPIGSDIIDPERIAEIGTQLGSAFFGKSGGFLTGVKQSFSVIIDEVLKGGEDILKKEVELRNKLNGQIGIAGDLSRQYRNNIIGASDAAKGMGYSMDMLIDTSISATKETGRFYTLTERTMENMAVTSRAFIGDMERMGPILRQFEEIGVGADKTLENINEAGKRALTLGLNTKKTTEDLTRNLGKINEYGFKNGIQGLAEMTRKATEFRMSMDEAFKVADKVMSPEGAIDLAANLQVLGGAVGALADPFQMMYMATNNVEGLQDALIGAAKSLTTYNSEQGRFEITGVNLRRAKQMAQELGVSYQELAKGAIAAAERSSAASDLMAAGVTVDEKQQEFITNLAKMGPGGKMVIEIPQSIADKLGIKDREQALEDLDQSMVNTILENQKAFEKMDVKDIALEQFTETQKMALNVSEIAQMLKVSFAETYRGYGARIDEYIKKGNDILGSLKGGENKENKPLNDEINRIKSAQISSAEETGKKKLAEIEKQKPTSIDNKSKEKETTPTTENKAVSAEEMERIMNNVAFRNENALARNRADTTFVYNPASPRDY